jgi:hypothetical protein
MFVIVCNATPTAIRLHAQRLRLSITHENVDANSPTVTHVVNVLNDFRQIVCAVGVVSQNGCAILEIVKQRAKRVLIHWRISI